MAHATTSAATYGLAMSWRVLLLTAAKYFVAAAGGMVLFLAPQHRSVFDYDSDDWRGIGSAGVVAAVGVTIEALAPGTGYGLVRKAKDPASKDGDSP